MNQKDKELLLQDCCARLPYGVKVQFCLPNYQTDSFDEEIGTVFSVGTVFTSVHCKGIDYLANTNRVKPYLRPMSSMTDEEKVEYNDFNLVLVGYEGRGLECAELFDWLNAHHFDYRGLIEKELALPAKEEMYGLRKSI